SAAADTRTATTAPGVTLGEAAQAYHNYIAATYEGFANGSEPAAGGVEEGGEEGARSYRTSSPPSAYVSRVRSGGGVGVPRRYDAAIAAEPGARGVAAGAPVTAPLEHRLERAAWVANRQDDRFGRLLLEVHADGQQITCLTRTLFADSALTAIDLLWGNHRGTSAFTEREVLVLMQIDPFARVDSQANDSINQQLAELERQAELIDENDLTGQLALVQRVMEVQREARQLPQRVVFHPALHGRELAWSTARVPFWLDNLTELNREASAVNGGTQMAPALANIPLTDAGTWRFYDRPSRIQLVQGTGSTHCRVRVESYASGADASERSHYAVAIFAPQRDDKGGTERLVALERRTQDLLDWLAVNHHDFVRLNDFSEAFSLLRWARSSGVTPVVNLPRGAATAIVSPDRIVADEGPMVR
ncbi:MAG: hypothetical protein AAFX85_14625, partial [Pseudomonadota bacterium]